jgi:hypothetical protein
VVPGSEVFEEVGEAEGVRIFLTDNTDLHGTLRFAKLKVSRRGAEYTEEYKYT